jgi:transposase
MQSVMQSIQQAYLAEPASAPLSCWKAGIPPVRVGGKAKPGGNKRTVNLREIANGLMYILSTGRQWRAIPKDLRPRSTLHDYLDLWSWDGALVDLDLRQRRAAFGRRVFRRLKCTGPNI